MVWFKRLLPILIIGAVWIGYQQWQLYAEQERNREEKRLALVTAQVWVATAIYRDDSARYLAYRDSLLKVSGVAVEDLYDYLERYENRPEQYLPFALKVSRYVDSLVKIQDSTSGILPDSLAGSTGRDAPDR